MKSNLQKIGTFNCQGLVTSTTKTEMLANDFEQYNMSALCIQETHMQGHGVEEIMSSSGNKYLLYFSGHIKKSINGVGLIVERNKKS